MSIVHRGGCLCGEIRFEAIGPAGEPHTCSCDQCQRHTGTLTACWVEFPRENVKWVGTGGAPAAWRSSDCSSRAFCSRCGSSIGALDDKPIVALLVGAFDDRRRQDIRPQYHSFEDGRPHWWHIAVR